MTTIGFIGLGQMGKRIAANLIKPDRTVLINDLNRDAAAALEDSGAQWVESAQSVAESADVLFTSLPTPAVIETIAYGSDGIAETLRPHSVWVDFSTNSLDLVRRLHTDLKKRDVGFLDAPVSGGPAGAESAQLAVWVGGEEHIYDQVLGLIHDVARQIRRVGDIGAGTTAKLLHNTVSATVHAAIAEVLSVGIKAGIEPADLFETLRSGAAGQRRTFDAIIPRFLAGNFEPASFQLQLSYKDLGLARKLAQDLGVPTRLSDLAYDELTEAMNRGWATRDMQSFMTLQQERAGNDPIEIPMDVLEGIKNRT